LATEVKHRQCSEWAGAVRRWAQVHRVEEQVPGVVVVVVVAVVRMLQRRER
jgi:hypothetical protein